MTFTTALQRSVAAAALIFVNLSTLSAQSDSVYHLVVGTRISVKMDVELNSNVAGVNDTFTAVVAKPVMIRDTIAVPVGTVVEGRVRGASAASVGDDGKLDLVFELLRIPNLPSRHIEAELVEPVHARSSGLIKALSVVGGTVVGAVLGAAAKGSTGAAIGAGTGAGVGTAIAFLRKGKNARVREDQEFEIVLRQPVVLPVLDY